MNLWFLQTALDSSHNLQEIALNHFPQILGRDEDLPCVVRGATVSRNHARLELNNGKLLIADLDSSNGTFVNRQRITTPVSIDHGDIIHLGSTELRLINRGQEPANNATRIMGKTKLSDTFPAGIKELEELIAQATVNIVYQPIILASNLSRIGFEALCRGASASLPTNPLELFRIAESFNLETALSEMLRSQALLTAEKFNLQGEFLLNTHPTELQKIDRLISSIRLLRKRHPALSITIEIHEHAITEDGNILPALKHELRQLNMKLAFDDFGVGQSRLMEMIEAQPDLIKFDKKLIENIDSADTSRIHLIKSLIGFAQELKIATLAECVATEAEFQRCQALGFEYYQGYHFAKPQMPDFF